MVTLVNDFNGKAKETDSNVSAVSVREVQPCIFALIFCNPVFALCILGLVYLNPTNMVVVQKNGPFIDTSELAD
jgi:hypothetical protein